MASEEQKFFMPTTTRLDIWPTLASSISFSLVSPTSPSCWNISRSNSLISSVSSGLVSVGITRLINANSARNCTSALYGCCSIAFDVTVSPPNFTSMLFCSGVKATFTKLQQLMACNISSWANRLMESNMITIPFLLLFEPLLKIPRVLTMAVWKSIPSLPPKGRARRTRVWKATVWSSMLSGKRTIARRTLSVRPARWAVVRWDSSSRRYGRHLRHMIWIPSTSANATIQLTTEYMAQDQGRFTLSTSPAWVGLNNRSVNMDRPNLCPEPFRCWRDPLPVIFPEPAAAFAAVSLFP
mmetsp:Transcript_172/g.295  ORF Transcript_172/g.295 Transcript_172/m.295 type:complete len:297 (-) Transcript_172:875-1765(-)